MGTFARGVGRQAIQLQAPGLRVSPGCFFASEGLCFFRRLGFRVCGAQRLPDLASPDMLPRARRWASRAQAGSRRRCCWGAGPSAPPCPRPPPSSAPSSPPSSWRSTGCARRWWCAAHTPRSPFSVPQPPIPCRATHTIILIANLLLYLRHALWWVLWMVVLHQEGAFTACAALPAGAREAQRGGGCRHSKVVPAAGGGTCHQ